MRILATGTLTVKNRACQKPRRSHDGFTLLEILAVIVIIGITVSFASLSLSSRAVDERLVTEADRLLVLLKLAADEAVVQGEELGLLLAGDGYAFYHLEDHKWIAYPEGPLRERTLPDGTRLYLASEGREEFQLPKPKDNDKNAETKKKQTEPQILMLSSGELTPFVLELRAGHLPVYYRVEGKITGQISMERLEEKTR